MIRILHTADLLLDYSFPDGVELAAMRRSDQLRTFEKLINLAIKNEVDLVVFAGNLFATPRPEPEIVETVCSGLQRLVDRQIVPVVLPGGLDGVLTPDNLYRLTSIPGLLISDLRHVRRPLTLELGSSTVHLYGFAWGGSDGDPAALSSMKRLDQPGFHVGVLQACADGDPSQYIRTLPAVDTAMLQTWGFDYIALGNCRNWQEMKSGDKILGAFPGTPEGVSFQEAGSRYCALVTLAEESTQLEKLASNSRTLVEIDIDISGLDSTEAIAGAVGEHAHPEVIVRAVLKGEPCVRPDLPEVHALLADRLAGLDIDDHSVLIEGEFAETLRKRGKPFSSLLEEAEHLRSQATAPGERRLLDDAFRTALGSLEKAAGGQS